jgi:hypothetical protein
LLAEGNNQQAFMTISHQGGTLALPVRQIQTAFFLAATNDQPATLRLTGAAFADGKLLQGAEAETIWTRLAKESAGRFITMTHLNGQLALPRRAIQSAFLQEVDGKKRLRLVYESDSSPKIMEGEEAERLWSALTVN